MLRFPSYHGQEWDKDKDGRLDYREFAAIFQHLGARHVVVMSIVMGLCDGII